MNLKKLDRRNPAMDITRIVSVLLVISVHFFLYNGFYSEPMKGPEMFVMCVMRTFFSACVPMFMLLSGYLMCNKQLNKKYFFGISKTLVTYLLAGAACIIYRAVHLHTVYDFKKVVYDFLNFSAAQYAWYIEMYIGLFLLIPFLNILYNKLETERNKQILVLVMIVLTVLPTLLNIFKLDTPSWWGNPTSSDEFTKVVPAWWIGFYPVTYYFTGCYLREYGLRFKTRTVAILLVLTTLAFSIFNFWRSYGTGFKTGLYAYWYGFQPYVTSVLLFDLLRRIKGEKMTRSTKFVLWKLSDLCLSIYLVSFIFDSYLYPFLNKKIAVMTDRLYWFVPMVVSVFICSVLLSIALHFVEMLLKFLVKKAVALIRMLKEQDGATLMDICFILVIALAGVFAFWKAYYGFGGDDESFYLTVPHRLSLGDMLFADEWHLSQLSGFITMPFVWLYRMIVGSTDGIILAARYLYVVLHALVAIFLYIRTKKYGALAAVAAVLYFIYTPYDIMAVSYNTMALDFTLLAGILLATSQKKLHFVFGGICFAAAVLCCPYLAATYVLYLLCVAVRFVLRNRNIEKLALSHDMFSLSKCIWFSAGILILAVVFMIYILCTCGIGAIFENLPKMLTDPEHPQIGISNKLGGYFNGILNCHPQFKLVLYSYIAMLVVMLIDRNRKNHRAFYLIISCMFTLVCYVMFYPNLIYAYYNAIMMPMVFVGLTAYILCENKPKSLFCSVFIGGILYSFAVTMGSNQYFYVISMACAATNTASFVFLAQLFKEMKQRPDEVAYGDWLRRGSIVTAALAISVLGFMQIDAKANHCFWDGSPDTLTYRISSGPARGIYTTAVNYNEYERFSSDLEYYETVENGNILMLTSNTYCYLMVDDMPYGSFSAWISGENETALRRLEEYYSINPDKVPQYIYVPKGSGFDTAGIAATAQKKGYTLIENDVSYKLTKQ